MTPASPATERYNKISYSAEALDTLLVDLFMEAHPGARREIVLDLDATDTPLHGRQEARFFHGYYGHYCYLPLYVFCGDHLLCARLRPSNIDASAGSLEEVQRIVRQIRGRWPKTRIILRADSGFCREELLAWCENNDVDYVFGFARNKRLRRIIGRAMREAKQEHRRTGKPARCIVPLPGEVRAKTVSVSITPRSTPHKIKNRSPSRSETPKSTFHHPLHNLNSQLVRNPG